MLPYGKTYQVLLGLLRGQLFVVGKQELLALTDGSELARRTKRLICFLAESVMSLDGLGRHSKRVVVFSQRAFWVQRAGVEYFLARFNDPLLRLLSRY